MRKLQRRILDDLVRLNPKLGLDQRAENFVALFERHLPAASRILDIGGSWGFYAQPLENRGHDVTVLDVVRPGYQKAPVVLYDGKRMPFQDKSFDVSLLITVLHHIADVKAVIQEAKRVTRKKVIVIEDLYRHNLGRWWTILRDRIYNFEYVGHPCNFKKAEEWEAWFGELDFKLVEHKKIYTWLAGLRILNGLFVFEIGGNHDGNGN